MSVNFGKVLFLFIVLPFIELYLLLKLAAATSAAFTFATIIGTGLLGAFLAKQQGQRVYRSIQTELSQGRLPGDNMLHGLCVLIGGILLLTPGILSDLTGILLLLPFTRVFVIRFLKRQFSGLLQKEVVRIYSTHEGPVYADNRSGGEGPRTAWQSDDDDEPPIVG